MRNFVPIVTVTLVIFALWYAFAIVLNRNWAEDKAQRGGYELSFSELVADTWTQKKPRLPTPDQVAAEIWKSTGAAAIRKWGRSAGRPLGYRLGKVFGDKKSLLRHAWLTLSATMLGFVFGTGLGILLAVGIVHNRAMDNSIMPWVITSQTIPILALAPMIIVVLNAVGVSGLVPKAIISAYLSFFPVVVGMVKGLRSPDSIQLDQMRTWFASKAQIFWKLRLPASVPYLFTSLKIGVAASLVGAIVGELTISQDGGLGARMLQGNYYGSTILIWAALIFAAAMAALLVSSVGLVERLTKKRMGFVA
jgi:NitT/TauT family transport system permease protein